MKHTLRIAVTFCFLSTLSSAPALYAASSNPCDEARESLNVNLDGATDEQCLRALERAKFDKWQLWLDLAAVSELTGNSNKAAISLSRFLEDSNEGDALPSHWQSARDKAEADLTRLEDEILEEQARVTFQSTPSQAIIEVAGQVKEAQALKTPDVLYLYPGSYSVKFIAPDGQSIRKEFNVTKGMKRIISVEFDEKLTELSQNIKNDAENLEAAAKATAKDGASVLENSGQASLEAVKGLTPPTKSGVWTHVGQAVTAIGGASLVAGIMYSVEATHLENEAACKGNACQIDADLRRQVKDKASSSWNSAAAFFVTGAVLVGGGITAILLDREDEEDAPSTSFTPWFSDDGGGLTGQVRF